ncbi:MAG: hypothetical protein AB8B63_14895 [Granulosicoccus sp.]
MKSTSRAVLALVCCTAFLYACSSSSSDNNEEPSNDESMEPTEPALLTGVLGRTAVEGVFFNTDSQQGVTNSAGEFQYVDGESVTFSIGTLNFPEVSGSPLITPISMGAGASDPLVTSSNIARLLQSLDDDDYPYDGISIPASAASSSTPLNFDVSIAAFESNPNVINMVANSGGIRNTLIPVVNSNIILFQIKTSEEFTEQVVDKRLVSRRTGGVRDTNNQLEIDADGTIVRYRADGAVDFNTALTWYWQDQFFCREGSSGGEQRPLDCQVISLQETDTNQKILTFVGNRGTGETSNWFVE